jgi:hypothetical protein
MAHLQPLPLISALLLFLGALVSAAESPTQRIQKLMDLIDFTYEETLATPEGEEILMLAGRADVRKWLQGRINDFLEGNDEMTKERKRESPDLDFEPDSYRMMIHFRFLVTARVTEDEIKLAASIARKDPSFAVSLIHLLLIRSPYTLSQSIRSKLLPTLVQEIDGTLGTEAVNSLWLASARFTPAAIRELLQVSLGKGASKEPVKRRNKPEQTPVTGEIQVLKSDGTPFLEGLWTQTLGLWFPVPSLIWPDGKVRFRYFGMGKDEKEKKIELSLAVPGYERSNRLAITLRKGEVAKASLSLPAARAMVRGKLSPAPKSPLFAVLGRTPLGQRAPRYFDDEMVALVNPDGAFAAPRPSEKDRGKVLLIYDGAGDVVASFDVPGTPGDLDLGELKMKESGKLSKVPVEVELPAGLPSENQLSVNLTWKPASPGLATGWTHLSFYPLPQRLVRGRLRIGKATNLVAGTYSVEASLEKGGGGEKLGKVQLPFKVGDGKTSLVLSFSKGAKAR